jgi:hypothetical protein
MNFEVIFSESNKLISVDFGATQVDLGDLTVTPEMLAEGVVAIDSSGKIIVGTAKVVTLAVLGSGKIGLVVI